MNEGEDVAAGAVLVRIDNPETIAENEQALTAKIVAEAQLANINAGTRAEVIAARKAARTHEDEPEQAQEEAQGGTMSTVTSAAKEKIKARLQAMKKCP